MQFVVENESNELHSSTRKMNQIIEKIIIKSGIEDIYQIFLQIKKSILPLFITKGISQVENGQINFQKLIKIFSQVVTANKITNDLLEYVFKVLITWMVNKQDIVIIQGFFKEFFVVLSLSKNIYDFLILQTPRLIIKEGRNNNLLMNQMLSAVYSTTSSLTVSKDSLNFIYQYLQSVYKIKNSLNAFDILELKETERVVFFYLLGRILSNDDNYFIDHINSLYDVRQFDLFQKIPQDALLYKILHSQLEGLNNSHLLANIISKFCIITMNKYGFPQLSHVLIRWYSNEHNPSFRYAFHLSYANLIRGDQGIGILNFCYDIIILENEPDVLFKVIKNLYNTGVSWETLYIFLIAPFLTNCDQNQLSYKNKLTQLFEMYRTDLSQSYQAKLISKTEDLFLALWIAVGKKERKNLYPLLSKWVKNAENTSNTLKSILITSLINRSNDEYWKIALNTLLEKLGTPSVQILDDKFFKMTISVLNEKTSKKRIINDNLWSEHSRSSFCMGCKQTFDQKDKNLSCLVCKFSFCKDCSKTWKKIIESGNKIKCLGSTILGKEHKFTAIS